MNQNDIQRIDLYTAIGMSAWLCSQTKYYKTWALNAFDTNIVPPLMKNQYKIYLDEQGTPVGLVTWAWLNGGACDKAMQGESLLWEEWTSGNHLYCHDFLAPWGHGKKIFKDMKEQVFPEVGEVKAVRRDLNGAIRCRVQMKEHKRTE